MDDNILVVSLQMLLGPAAILLVLSLSRVDDAFKIREELLGTIVVAFCASGMDIGGRHVCVNGFPRRAFKILFLLLFLKHSLSHSDAQRPVAKRRTTRLRLCSLCG